MKFYLGTHRPHWLWDEQFVGVPLFVSHVTLRERRTPFPQAVTSWALDSGGFSELDRHHRFETTPKEYIAAVRRYSEQLGSLDWAAPQDWMCEPHMIAKTGLSVAEHQRRTVDNFVVLRTLAPDLPFAPVLQGWELSDYLRCVSMYAAAGVDLLSEPVVGVGSVCRRQHAQEIGDIFAQLKGLGLVNLHGFGVKKAGIALYGHEISTSDSLAWSYRARRHAQDQAALGIPRSCPKKNCANCAHFALEWRERILSMDGAR